MDGWEIGIAITTIVATAATAFGGSYFASTRDAKQRRNERVEQERRELRNNAAPVLANVGILLEEIDLTNVERRTYEDRLRIVSDWHGRWNVYHPDLAALGTSAPDDEVAQLFDALRFHTFGCIQWVVHGAQLMPPGSQPDTPSLEALLDLLRERSGSSNPSVAHTATPEEWDQVWTSVAERTTDARVALAVLKKELRFGTWTPNQKPPAA